MSGSYCAAGDATGHTARGPLDDWADLRRLLAKIGARVVPGPEVAVASAATMFAPDGTLVHAPTRDDLRALVAALAATAQAEAAEAVA